MPVRSRPPHPFTEIPLASFCAKCGTPLTASTGFCPSCGTPIAAPAAPAFTPVAPVPTPSQPYTAPQGYTQVAPGTPQPNPYTIPQSPNAYPGAQPTSQSGSVLKIILIVIAAIIGLFLLVGGFIGYKIYRGVQAVKHSIDTDDKTGSTTFTTPGGSFNVGGNVNASEAELGVPIYPGATHAQGGMRLKTHTASIITVVYKTTADADTVVNFYKAKLPDADEVSGGLSNGTVLRSGKKNDQIMVTVSSIPDSTEGTQITIMHTKSTQE